MHTETHRVRFFIVVFVLTLLALLFARPSHGGWGADPVQVHATNALCPLVAACDDGAFGAIVVWQEQTATAGLLRARHLLASGDLDPAWSAPALVSDRDATRGAMGAVRDANGGAYVWWMESASLYLTHVSASGDVVSGWPASGRLLGPLVSADSRPVALADGTGGVYVAWLTVNGVLPAWVVVRAQHLGPANTAKDGWPSGGRALGGTASLGEHAASFGIGLAADGGLWLACGSTTVVVETASFAPGEVRVSRYTGAGTPAPGWSPIGVTLAPFNGDLLANNSLWGLAPPMRLTAIADAGDGGAFVLFGSVAADEFNVWAGARLQRVDAAGLTAPGWPAGGVNAPAVSGLNAYSGRDARASLQVVGDLRGGVFVGRPEFFDHATDFSFRRYTGAGAPTTDRLAIGLNGLEASARGDGGIVAASFQPTGPYGPFQPSAYLQADQTDPGASFFEIHNEPVIQWYGDIGLAATGDGGSIFTWSQVNQRFGIFAIRLNPSGQVTSVPPGPTTRGPRVWFVRGAGVRVEGTSGRSSLSLHDLTGREVARGGAADAGAWTVPGTATLPSGMYFARVVVDGRAVRFKIPVLR